jgi:hypothetical protein
MRVCYALLTVLNNDANWQNVLIKRAATISTFPSTSKGNRGTMLQVMFSTTVAASPNCRLQHNRMMLQHVQQSPGK